MQGAPTIRKTDSTQSLLLDDLEVEDADEIASPSVLVAVVF